MTREDEGYECEMRLPSNPGNHDIGSAGEQAAAMLLERLGYTVVERNWRCRIGEVDVIALGPIAPESDVQALHFIEVKTRMSELRGFPSDAVDWRKRKKYEKLVEAYLRANKLDEDVLITFDVMSVLVVGRDRGFARFYHNVQNLDCE